ncbi:MAG: AI-2E family transporter [Pseudomonadales bacterium]|nr:AI-2E family transporter [Pseudomonadales bacterium]MCP5182911.1 AI-2E family transporter [Pseudomonadales bacterium]
MKFLEVLGNWINRYFSHEEAIYLIVFLVGAFVVLFTLGGVLAPVLTGLVLAFLLQGLVSRLQGMGLPRGLCVYLTFLLFLGGMVALILFLVPLVWRQSVALANALPDLIGRLREMAKDLAASSPQLVTPEQLDAWLEAMAGDVGHLSGDVVQVLLNQVPSLVGWVIYIILVPLAVFFFLKDKDALLGWFLSLLPGKRPMLDRVGAEMNLQIANYVRGKFIEILLVGAATFVAFTVLGLNYAALLGVLVGLSVLVPFIGASVVTIPVVVVAVLQFGWTWDGFLVIGVYLVIQMLDGNVLVPLLFSEAVDLHPINIIVAVLVFGGLWGFWGVFFAIPLATLVKAIYNAWPRGEVFQQPDA